MNIIRFLFAKFNSKLDYKFNFYLFIKHIKFKFILYSSKNALMNNASVLINEVKY